MQSTEVLRLQDELHKELLAKELRLQEELLTRQAREETAQLRKAYADDLARNVNAERTAILVRCWCRVRTVVVGVCDCVDTVVTERLSLIIPYRTSSRRRSSARQRRLRTATLRSCARKRKSYRKCWRRSAHSALRCVPRQIV